jgi:hypothetical protein
MQRGGNALGLAVLEVSFFTVLGHAMGEGVGDSAAYVRAFACVVCWIIAMLVVVVGLLICSLRSATIGPPADKAGDGAGAHGIRRRARR